MVNNYQLVDAGNFKKLEKVGPYLIERPSAQAVWKPSLPLSKWKKIDASFSRIPSGEGKWTFHKSLPEYWDIDVGRVKMRIRLTDFGHIGIFPEHHGSKRLVEKISQKIINRQKFKLLNLFAYTGAVTLAAARVGAQVTHVDASKTSVNWAKENAKISLLSEKPVRWIVDDVQKYLQREIKRGNKYQGVVLDPPSFGRGPKGDVWKIEDHLVPLLDDLKKVLSEDFSYFQLSAHSQGYTPTALKNLLGEVIDTKLGQIIHNEMCVTISSSQRDLPSGASVIFEKGDS